MDLLVFDVQGPNPCEIAFFVLAVNAAPALGSILRKPSNGEDEPERFEVMKVEHNLAPEVGSGDSFRIPSARVWVRRTEKRTEKVPLREVRLGSCIVAAREKYTVVGIEMHPSADPAGKALFILIGQDGFRQQFHAGDFVTVEID